MLKRKLKTRRFSKRLKLQGLTRRIEQALIVRRANLPYPPSMSQAMIVTKGTKKIMTLLTLVL